MNPNELIQRYLHGEATDVEVADLDRLLASDRDLRRKLIVETGIDAGLCEIARERASQPSVVAPRRSVWLSWRTLAAAAAIVVIGLLAFEWSRRGVEVEVVQTSGAISGDWVMGHKALLNHVTLVRGSVQMRLSSGVLLDVNAPIEMNLITRCMCRYSRAG